MRFDEYVPAVEQAARRAASKLMDMLGQVDPVEKAPRDLVSAADFASQEIIYHELVAIDSSFEFLGEENTEQSPDQHLEIMGGDRPVWVVDPLDGTINYIHQLPGFAVSIGLVVSGQPILGVIYDPSLDEMFSASFQNGATMNGRPIRASNCRQLDQALLAASLPSRLEPDSIELRRFVEIAIHSRALRRLGSAALNLAYVACGRLDGYWATTVHSWDVAAGIAIATEAGAELTGALGGSFCIKNADFCVASTVELQRSITDRLAALATGDLR